ncbi:unnamed protein product [Ilex paraguariensis]|uniref:HRDC domain-containing protein n=1 Tax=Ilex paraguariensis TaxID=185542 RepID=A0ABC8UGR0_9AQUA
MFPNVSVSSKGLQFLSSCRPDHQPPLILRMTGEMVDHEEQKNRPSEVSEFNGLAPLQYEGLSQAEAELYKMLLEKRMKFARAAGTAPYAICGDQTLKKIALARPSTKARLANIDGVNQHLMTMYGDLFLQSIQHLSRGLNLSLDGETSIQPAITKRIYTVPNHQTKLTPAKFEAWKMWQEDGLSIQKIASFPSRSVPIKEETVINYLLEAAREGCVIDWTRFCEGIGLTQDVVNSIQTAVSKLGSKDKLKPIKNELPEEISYVHIKAYLTMDDLGLSAEGVQSCHQPSCKANENSEEMSELSQTSYLPSHVRPCDVERLVNTAACHYSSDDGEGAVPVPLVLFTSSKQAPIFTDDLHDGKRQKVDATGEENPVAPEATESSILNWIKKFDHGVSQSDIFKHFKGSTKESIVDLLSCLETPLDVWLVENL